MKFGDFRQAPSLSIAIALLLLGSPVAAAVKISSKPTQNMTCTDGICTPTAKKAVLNISELADMLATGDATVKSSLTGQDIEIDAPLNWTTSGRLTLDSRHSIVFTRPLIVAGTGGLTIVTNHGGAGGDFSFVNRGHVEFWDLHGNLVINGQQYVLFKNLKNVDSMASHGTRFMALVRSHAVPAHMHAPMQHWPDVFEGLGNTISGLAILDDVTFDNVGLFAGVNIIRDLTLVDVQITGRGASQRVGAFAGDVGTAIINCYASGQVTATRSESRAGGLAGDNLGSIVRSHSDVTVSAGSGAKAAGGLIGQNDGKISKSYSSGSVTGGDGVMVGGLVGYTWAGSIQDSYATGPVTGGANSFVGGLTGSSFANGDQTPVIAASYSVSALTGGSGATIGGLIGEDIAQTGNADNYWDLETSGVSDPHQGAGNVADDPGLSDLTTAEFKSGLPSGFELATWKENAALNAGYPYLIDNLPPE